MSGLLDKRKNRADIKSGSFYREHQSRERVVNMLALIASLVATAAGVMLYLIFKMVGCL